MRIVTVLGTRPQIIKASTVHRALARRGLEDLLVDTGQHYDPEMASLLYEELGLDAPAVDCEVGSAGHGAQTGRMLEAVEGALLDLRPDRVLVYGDTNSTLAGALAAAKLGIPVAHVEAGLRSHDMAMPEEINRVLTDRLCDLLFAPTQLAADQLVAEGLRPETVHTVGDVMYDAALEHAPVAAEAERRVRDLLGREPRAPLVLATVHRAENTEPEPLRLLVAALAEIARDHDVVVPLHPRTRGALEAAGLDEGSLAPATVLRPTGYRDTLALLRTAQAVVTDSGGLQKEAFFLGRPCVTLRSETEWRELVDCGWNRLVKPATGMGAALRSALAEDPPASRPEGLFGGGRAAARIADRVASQQTP